MPIARVAALQFGLSYSLLLCSALLLDDLAESLLVRHQRALSVAVQGHTITQGRYKYTHISIYMNMYKRIYTYMTCTPNKYLIY